MVFSEPLGLGINDTAAAQKSSSCNKTVYLTFDTGNMSVANAVASILLRQNVKATFFLANEKTNRGDFSLDDSWKSFWQERYLEDDAFAENVYLKPQFGPNAGRVLVYKPSDFCIELDKVNSRFKEMTGHSLEPIWRAPGGKTSSRLISIAKQCGYSHVSWASAGFLGDELSSREYPNKLLLERASTNLQDGDIAMAHLGIWSRKDVWATAVLEPLITNLKKRGCGFGLLP